MRFEGASRYPALGTLLRSRPHRRADVRRATAESEHAPGTSRRIVDDRCSLRSVPVRQGRCARAGMDDIQAYLGRATNTVELMGEASKTSSGSANAWALKQKGPAALRPVGKLATPAVDGAPLTEVYAPVPETVANQTHQGLRHRRLLPAVPAQHRTSKQPLGHRDAVWSVSTRFGLGARGPAESRMLSGRC
jgi:hypothetical protein